MIRKITIKQLLLHIIGWPEVTQNDLFINNIDKSHTPNEIINIAFKGDFRSEPGEKYLYNNTGYIIAAALIEKLMGSGMNLVNLIFPDEEITITVIRNISKPAHNSNELAFLAAGFLIR